MEISYLVSIILGLLPSFAWLVFYLREDARKPEPMRLILFVFLIGAVSSFVVLPLQMYLNDWLLTLGVLAYSPISLLILSAIEEIIKFIAVYWAISKSKEFDEPLDAMIYMIVAALGFAAVENVASLFQASGGLETVALRFIGATLLHTLTSGLIGFYWAKALINRHNYAGLISVGLLIATILHAAFNYLIISTGPLSLAIVFLAFVAYFLFNDFEIIKREEHVIKT